MIKIEISHFVCLLQILLTVSNSTIDICTVQNTGGVFAYRDCFIERKLLNYRKNIVDTCNLLNYAMYYWICYMFAGIRDLKQRRFLKQCYSQRERRHRSNPRFGDQLSYPPCKASDLNCYIALNFQDSKVNSRLQMPNRYTSL